ncbi:MAG: cytochrome P450, partial [Aquihabitans sp.]
MSTDVPDSVLGLNPFEPGYYDDPYQQYAGLRENDPVHKSAFGPWLVSRWADVHAILRRPGMSVEEDNASGESRRQRLAEMVEGREVRKSQAILNIDPPDHTRIRRLVSKAFTPRAVEHIRARAGEMVDEILDDLATREGPVDLVSELAFPLPFTVISEMLGMPDGDRDQLRTWSHTVTQVLDPILAMQHTAEIFEAIDHMQQVVTDAIAWKRGRLDQDDDLLAALIRAEDGGDVLSDGELVENVVLLYLAGHETTVNLISNGVNALLNHRDQLDRLATEPDLTTNAIEELLRFDSPVQFSRRIALETFEFGEHTIEAGDFVMTCLGAANRDPRKFGSDADQLDLGRADAREHVSFGSGVHHCL